MKKGDYVTITWISNMIAICIESANETNMHHTGYFDDDYWFEILEIIGNNDCIFAVGDRELFNMSEVKLITDSKEINRLDKIRIFK